MTMLRKTVFCIAILCLSAQEAWSARGEAISDTASLLRIIRADTLNRNCATEILERTRDSVFSFHTGSAAAGLRSDQGTFFNVGSCSKTYMAALTLLLQERGLLRINEPVIRYITVPGLKIRKGVTIRHLLNHTSGVPDYSTPDRHIEALLDTTRYYSTTHILDYVSGKSKAPGTYSYNNLGYFILGWIIESVTQLPLETALQTYLFEPLKLKRTCFHYPAEEGNVAVPGYELLYPSEGRINRINQNNLSYAAGNIYTSAEDFSRFIRALFIDKAVLHDSSVALMTGMAVPVFEKNQYSAGLGTYTSVVGGHRMYSHTGRLLLGYTALYACFPELDYTITILRNDLIEDYEHRGNTLNKLLLQLLKQRGLLP